MKDPDHTLDTKKNQNVKSPIFTELLMTHTLYGKVGSCLLMVGSLKYSILTVCMYWFPLPMKLPIVI